MMIARVSTTLSLLVLVLFNSSLTLPISNEQLFNSTTHIFIKNNVTHVEIPNPPLLTDDTTSMPLDPEKKESIDEHMGFEMTTDVQAVRSIDEYSTSQPMEWSTEQSLHQKREDEEVTSPSMITESSTNNEDNEQSLSSITIEATTPTAELDRRNFSDDIEDNTLEMSVQSTDDHMISWTTSTKNSPNYRKNKYEDSIDPLPNERKTSSARKSNRYSDEKSPEEISQDSTIPTAFFVQKAFDQVVNIPNDFLILDENTDLIVTGLPERISSSSSTTMIYQEKEALNQGEESSHSEEKESNH